MSVNFSPLDATNLPLPTQETAYNLADTGTMFSANFEVGSIGLTEIPIALYRNPAGSGVSARVWRITFSNITPASWIRIRVYANPTVTATGTGIVEFCTKTNAGTASVQVFASPTISANGFRLNQWIVPFDAGTLEVFLSFIYVVEPGVDLLVTAQADAVARTLAGSAIWAEN